MEPTTRSLPKNAYTPLQPGEKYIPLVPAGQTPREISLYSVGWGMFFSVLFSAAAAYLGLKIGQVFEAAIPIAIIAVGFSTATKRKNALSENVIIQSIGASSGVVVAGAIFTIPALYILNLPASFLQVFLASMFGGFLGILYLIPFRRYFVKEMHGELPFPEATATTEVLVAGESGGNQAKILLTASLVGGAYDFLVATFGAWKETFSTKVLPGFSSLAENFRLEFRLNTLASVMGLGYIIGLKYAAIICAGSFLSWFVLIPLIGYLGNELPYQLGTLSIQTTGLDAAQVFRAYVRHIGIGGIAMAGLIGIFKSRKIIAGAMSLAASELFGRKTEASETATERTDKDIPMSFVVGLIVAVLAGVFIFFWKGVVGDLTQAITGLLIVAVIAFLFTTVAARAIAIVGTNPVSGMTLMTLIISSFILVQVGLTGPTGMISALIIGGVVCTALSMAGGFITDLKIGYWLGNTPKYQQQWKFLGTILAAASVGGVILLLNETYGFTGENALVAPQANAMAAVIQPLMSNQPAPWALYLAGAILAIILELIHVPPLAFALGMYIPLELNTPILAGGMVAHFVSKRSKDEKINTARRERGTLIASGFIAGGSIMGVVSAGMKFFGANYEEWGWTWVETPPAEMLAIVAFALLAVYLAWDSMRVKE
ncbi:MAG: oligopeptide transporter, OPT family [Ignavibacteriae bacterium]|nr:oligopeptide transporter, OPT family [Ignavibacteriota bacterium]